MQKYEADTLKTVCVVSNTCKRKAWLFCSLSSGSVVLSPTPLGSLPPAHSSPSRGLPARRPRSLVVRKQLGSKAKQQDKERQNNQQEHLFVLGRDLC